MKCALLLNATCLLASQAAASSAPIIDDNPENACYYAEFPESGSKRILGSVVFTSYEGIAKVSVDVAGLPKNKGTYMYHIHEFLAKKCDKSCNSTGEHLNPYDGVHDCSSVTDTSLCEVGDLSGKHGNIDSACYETEYFDPYLSLKPGTPSFVGNRSITVHYENNTRYACANIVPCKKEKEEKKSTRYATSTSLEHHPSTVYETTSCKASTSSVCEKKPKSSATYKPTVSTTYTTVTNRSTVTSTVCDEYTDHPTTSTTDESSKGKKSCYSTMTSELPESSSKHETKGDTATETDIYTKTRKEYSTKTKEKGYTKSSELSSVKTDEVYHTETQHDYITETETKPSSTSAIESYTTTKDRYATKTEEDYGTKTQEETISETGKVTTTKSREDYPTKTEKKYTTESEHDYYTETGKYTSTKPEHDYYTETERATSTKSEQEHFTETQKDFVTIPEESYFTNPEKDYVTKTEEEYFTWTSEDKTETVTSGKKTSIKTQSSTDLELNSTTTLFATPTYKKNDTSVRRTSQIETDYENRGVDSYQNVFTVTAMLAVLVGLFV